MFIFDNTFRHINKNQSFVLHVHIDQTSVAVISHMQFLLSDKVSTLFQSHVHIINVWHFLNELMQCSSFAFIDFKTIKDETLIAIKHRYQNWINEMILITHMNERWYYWSSIKDDKRILLKCFDSEKKERMLHTTFVNSRSSINKRQRKSIEIRTLMFKWKVTDVLVFALMQVSIFIALRSEHK